MLLIERNKKKSYAMEIFDRIKGNKTLLNGVFFSIFAFAGRGISFVLLIILASFIPPVDYGKLSLFNTVVMLLGFFMAFSTNGYFGISFFKEDKKTFHQDFSFIMMMLLVSVGLIAIVFLSLGNYLSSLTGVSYELLWWALVVALTSVPFAMYTDYYRLQEKVGMYGLLNLGNAILNAIFSILLVITFAQGWMGRVNTHIGVNILFFFIAVIFFLQKGFFDFHIKQERMKMILFWGLPQIPHMATNWIRQGCDQYIINYNYTTEEVGLFSFALNLVGIITMIGMAFNSSNSVTIFQVLSNKSEVDKKKVLNKNTRNIFLVYLVATVMTVFFGCVLVPIVLPKYIDSIPYFLILSIYGFMVCMYFLFCNYLFYYGYTKNLMYITFGTSILHLCLSLLLTRYSLYYTTIIYVISQTFCAGIVYWYSRDILKKELVSK
ncbi:MAG: oligosaccharide flippase family protein [Aeriscardovia sp.]|nr:oligosaccharide flippase family protein [Aeriscardovia sp.]